MAIRHLPCGRDWDEITLASIFAPEARGKKLTWIIKDHLRPVRVRIPHAVLDSGELTLSARRRDGYPERCVLLRRQLPNISAIWNLASPRWFRD